MSLFDLFRPKWQHSNPEVRAEAVRGLGDEDAETLGRIAKSDGDARVRRIAIKKLTDPVLLDEIARGDADDGLRKLAGDQASQLLVATACGPGSDRAHQALGRMSDERAVIQVAKNATEETVRRAALGRLSGDAARADVVRGAKELTARLEALAAIRDPAVLREIAVGETVKETALAAVERLDDAAALEAVWRGARNKVVRKAARARLDAAGAAAATSAAAPAVAETRPASSGPSPQQLREARQLQLIRIVEKLAGRTDWDVLERELQAARDAWHELGVSPDDDSSLAERFVKADMRVRERQAAHDAAQAAAARRAGEAERDRERQAAEKAERARRAEIEKQERAAQAERQVVLDAERAARDAEREKEREAERAVKHEADRARAEEQDKERQANLVKLEELCARLEGLVETSDGKRAERVLKDAQAAFASPPPLPREKAGEVRTRYQTARDKVVARLRELEEVKDWERWANVSKLEALCVRVEGMREEADLKKLAAGLRQAQADWKKVGPAPKEKSQALWTRFKTTCDELYAKAQEHFVQLDTERGDNLKKKNEMCDQAEALVGAENWADAAEKMKALQAEWKKVGPVPKADADAVWKRFRAAADRFFDRRKEHFTKLDSEREENLKKKEDLCAKAEAAAAATTPEAKDKDVKEAMRVIRKLQTDWKVVGPVPKAQSNELWKRFRAACDKVYEATRGHEGGGGGAGAGKPRGEEGRREDATAVQSSWRPATIADLLRASGAAARSKGGAASDEAAPPATTDPNPDANPPKP